MELAAQAVVATKYFDSKSTNSNFCHYQKCFHLLSFIKDQTRAVVAVIGVKVLIESKSGGSSSLLQQFPGMRIGGGRWPWESVTSGLACSGVFISSAMSSFCNHAP